MFAVPLLYLYPCLLRSFTLLLSYLLSFTWGTNIFIIVFLLYFTCDISAAPLLYLYPCFIFYLLPGAFLLLYLYRCFIFYLGNSGSSNTCSSCSDWDGNDLTWNWILRNDQKCGWIQFAKKTCRANIAPHFCSNLILVKRYD